MSELRIDPISNRPIIIAKNRAERPNAFHIEHVSQLNGRCPFCMGNEDETPPAIAIYRLNHQANGDVSWHVRVVPNKYPAVVRDTFIDHSTANGSNRVATGAHEVIIESPRHVGSITCLDDEVMVMTFVAYRERLKELSTDSNLAYGLLFKNVGPAAGASIEHSHSQLLATTFIPPEVERELTITRQFFEKNACCAFCDLIEKERACKQRIVCETDSFVAFCPYASRFPYETWILPRAHASHFQNTPDEQLRELALLLKDIIFRLETRFPEIAYNYLIHTSPFDTNSLAHYHWHLEVIPRLAKTAGFEWGSGCFINPVPPEIAAEALRNSHQSADDSCSKIFD